MKRKNSCMGMCILKHGKMVNISQNPEETWLHSRQFFEQFFRKRGRLFRASWSMCLHFAITFGILRWRRGHRCKEVGERVPLLGYSIPQSGRYSLLASEKITMKRVATKDCSWEDTPGSQIIGKVGSKLFQIFKFKIFCFCPSCF